jgi:hypothetical protein
MFDVPVFSLPGSTHCVPGVLRPFALKSSAREAPGLLFHWGRGSLLLFADLQKETKATKNSSFSSRSSVQ